MGAELSLGRVFHGTHYFPQDEISNLEVFVLDSRIVVLGHEVLVPCESLFDYRPNFVN